MKSDNKNQNLYRAWSEMEPNLPLWHQPWWLDLVAGEQNWDAVLLTKKNEIVATLPYVAKRKFGFKILTQPELCQFLGPYFESRFQFSESEKQNLLSDLEIGIPKNSAYLQSWSPENQNWKAFYWSDYKQTTHYTFRINLQAAEHSLKCRLKPKCRAEINKAINKFELRITESQDIESFWKIQKSVFSRANIKIPFEQEKIRKIVTEGIDRKALKMLVAVDPIGNIHAGGVFVIDNKGMYYLLGGQFKIYKSSGAMNLLIWEAIKMAKMNDLEFFDFEGSMHKGISDFFESFGGELVPIFSIWKYSNLLLRIFQALR